MMAQDIFGEPIKIAGLYVTPYQYNSDTTRFEVLEVVEILMSGAVVVTSWKESVGKDWGVKTVFKPMKRARTERWIPITKEQAENIFNV